jgi:NADH dehydrogenase (ubiquinone) Fe-S protein 5
VCIPAVGCILTHILFMQIARAKAVKAEFIKQAEHHAKEGRKVADVLADGVIVGVGLIQRDQSGEGKHK